MGQATTVSLPRPIARRSISEGGRRPVRAHNFDELPLRVVFIDHNSMWTIPAQEVALRIIGQLLLAGLYQAVPGVISVLHDGPVLFERVPVAAREIAITDRVLRTCLLCQLTSCIVLKTQGPVLRLLQFNEVPRWVVAVGPVSHNGSMLILIAEVQDPAGSVIVPATRDSIRIAHRLEPLLAIVREANPLPVRQDNR